MKGALIETFVVQNLRGILSARFHDIDLRFWHVQGRYEVDFILSRGNKTAAIEVKSGSRWQADDLNGLKAYLASDPNCFAGILAYNGTRVTQLDDRLWAIPLTLLLS
jgi:predicted AAA+ superfamily ATPase